MNTLQAYQTLEIKDDASFDEVKLAYRKLALELHPDRSKGDDKKFKLVTEAYHTLKNNQHTPSKNAKSWDFTDDETKKKRDFGKNNSQWGAPPKNEPPQQDWSKYTQDFEDENPGFWKEYERKFWEAYDAKVNQNGKNEEYEKTREPKKQPNLFVNVDPSLCIGCCSCEMIAPNVFEVDRLSRMNPKSKVHNMKGSGINKIMNAAETCPTKAIIVENLDPKEKLYPH